MDLREEFVLRAKGPGANISELCREHGISRKTGYKWLRRFEAKGIEALQDMTRRPRRVVQTAGEIVLRIAELRTSHRTWGPKKLRVLLAREADGDAPSVKTIMRILERLGEPRLRRVRTRSSITRPKTSVDVTAANELWTVDFKGWWRTRDGNRCEPLTVRDGFSRYVLCVRVMTSTALQGTQDVFLKLFKHHGLPKAIRMDNGSPFGCTSARGGLSKLSAWWCSLGINVVFGRPAHPEDNGAHERMHGDMALELERDGAHDAKSQQRSCDLWVHEFNHVRPHEALGMRTPAELYARSPRPYRGPKSPRYPISYDVRRVFKNGSVKFERRNVYVGAGFASQLVAFERVDENFVRLWFYERDLGLIDLSKQRQVGCAAGASETQQLKELAPKRRKKQRNADSSGAKASEAQRESRRGPKRRKPMPPRSSGTHATPSAHTPRKRLTGTSLAKASVKRSGLNQSTKKVRAKKQRAVSATNL